MTLKELRKVKGLTQVEASELLDIPLRTLKRYEKDDSLTGSFKYKQIYNNLYKIPAKTSQKQNKRLKIAVVGAGYVGLSLASLLSIKNDVTIYDIDSYKIELINSRKCYFSDRLLEKMFKDHSFKLNAMTVKDNIYQSVDVVIIATSTDFNSKTNNFDMESVNSSYRQIREENSRCLIVIKSTVPMGYTDSLKDENVVFCPEFLREGTAVHDNLFPSRIIIGANKVTPKIRQFSKCLLDISINNKNITYMSAHEAEAVKLFSNAYLAMRVAYFNELDTYAETNNLRSKNIIKGVSMDPRIGDYYNNPSFGYGGYCLPKDTAQLENSFLSISNNNIIRAIVESNETRKEYVVSQIIKRIKKNQIIGFYRLAMKKNSDNFRNSSTLDIANKLINKGYKVIIYEPNYNGRNKVNSPEELIEKSDIIIANRMDEVLKSVANKVYTRDQFGQN